MRLEKVSLTRMVYVWKDRDWVYKVESDKGRECQVLGEELDPSNRTLFTSRKSIWKILLLKKICLMGREGILG